MTAIEVEGLSKRYGPKVAVDDVVTQSASLKANVDSYNTARGAFKKARTALATGLADQTVAPAAPGPRNRKAPRLRGLPLADR